MFFNYCVRNIMDLKVLQDCIDGWSEDFCKKVFDYTNRINELDEENELVINNKYGYIGTGFFTIEGVLLEDNIDFMYSDIHCVHPDCKYDYDFDTSSKNAMKRLLEGGGEGLRAKVSYKPWLKSSSTVYGMVMGELAVQWNWDIPYAEMSSRETVTYVGSNYGADDAALYISYPIKKLITNIITRFDEDKLKIK